MLCSETEPCPVYTVGSFRVSTSHCTPQSRGPALPWRLTKCPSPSSSICNGAGELLRILALYRTKFFSYQYWWSISTTESNAGAFRAGEVWDMMGKSYITNMNNALVPLFIFLYLDITWLFSFFFNSNIIFYIDKQTILVNNTST